MISHRIRWVWLLASSFFFYGWFQPAYVVLLVAVVLLNYSFGRWIDRCGHSRKKQLVLTSGVIINVLILAGFKYCIPLSGFIFQWVSPGQTDDTVFSKLIMPLGISFFTFSNISYLIEVKRMSIKAEKHLGHFTNFVTFFPKLIQGPIERPGSFLSQLRTNQAFDYSCVSAGMRLIVWGFFKKLVIADRLSMVVDSVYAHPGQYDGSILLIATVFYAFQIYIDFSSYIDIARGAGAMLGFKLSMNFNRPYSSHSIKEFWTRWHITLSTWLRDYIFLPSAYYVSRMFKKERYAGVRSDHLIYAIAIILTFFICGIWHGVGWNYVIWGELFAIFLVFDRLTAKSRKRMNKKFGLTRVPWLHNSLQNLLTFLLVSFTWVFFRSTDTGDAFTILSKIFTQWSGDPALFNLIADGIFPGCPGFKGLDLILVLTCIPLVGILEYEFNEKNLWTRFQSFNFMLRWTAYYLFVMMILEFGIFDSVSFIYFKF